MTLGTSRCMGHKLTSSWTLLRVVRCSATVTVSYCTSLSDASSQKSSVGSKHHDLTSSS
jgi:hypothetical protein